MRAAGIPMSDAEPVNRTAVFVRERIIPSALALLPEPMDRAKARVMLMAIGLQESRFQHRRQIGGPAVGFWQFERHGGVRGVLEHSATRTFATAVLADLRYREDECYEAIVHNDILACVFARLLLWTHPGPLPSSSESAWAYYLATWRPGKPHPETWDPLYRLAWQIEEDA